VDELEIVYPQRIGRRSVTTTDPVHFARLETVRDAADEQAGLSIGSETQTGRMTMSEGARAAHLRAIKTKWPDLTTSQLATSLAAGRPSESLKSRVAFVQRTLKPNIAKHEKK
jgi:hypothetical protein